MPKEIVWVTVGSTQNRVSDRMLQKVRDVFEDEFEDSDDYHCFVVGEDIDLFDLETLKFHVDEVERLIDGG